MLIKNSRFGPGGVRPSEIAPKDVWLNRRELLGNAGFGLAALAAPAALWPRVAHAGRKLEDLVKSDWVVDDVLTPLEDITTYNNFYEFGTGKDDPSRYAGAFKPLPWSIQVHGECEDRGTIDYEDLIGSFPVEERIYRFRCVEAWSMVVPWAGVSLASVLQRFRPTSKAKYVAFETVYRPEEMRGQKRGFLDWPYVEGLRIDEAMHPLSLLAVGVYGEELPNQNGAPVRLVVPWKYGYKSIKSIVSITFTEDEPPTTWNRQAPHEYGFYSNVNPERPHPRWSQARERRLGGGLFARKIPTLKFNGYEKEVASLYAGMDLIEHH
ncbi:MAG: protein-methionine-sulfoxide reductase catalytic subunit MsrP [Immundisolibacterales bacterium]|nr:protein-methionine-sulfoxide reductase catalytic subunit MsrP [Immundisolibacterales bacterium]